MDVQSLLGEEAEQLLTYESKAISRDDLSLPGPDFIDRVFAQSDRSPQVLRNLQSLLSGGRLGGTGYVSILPVDQGIEHSAAASFAPNPSYFDPKNIVELAIEGGCNAVASTFGVLGIVSRRYAAPHPVHRQAQPQRAADLPEQVRPGDVRLGRAGLRPGRGRRRRHDLLRLRRVDPPDPRGQPGLRPGAPARHVHRAVVLPAQLRRSRRTASTITCRPTSRARPTTSASRSRPTSSSRSCPRTTAATTPSRATARPASSSTTS